MPSDDIKLRLSAEDAGFSNTVKNAAANSEAASRKIADASRSVQQAYAKHVIAVKAAEEAEAHFARQAEMASLKSDILARSTKAAGDAAHASVSQMQATSAALRTLEGGMTNNLRAAERFAASLPGVGAALQGLFPLIGGFAIGTMFVEAGLKAKEFIKTLTSIPGAISMAGQAQHISMEQTSDELDLQLVKMDNVRAKLEGKPQNKLAEAIAEGRVEADKLYEKLKSSSDVITQALQKNQIGIMGGFLGRVGTSEAENLQSQFQNDIAGIKARNLPEDQMQDLIKKRVEQLSDDSTKGLSSLPTKKAPWWTMGGFGGVDTEALKSDYNIIRQNANDQWRVIGQTQAVEGAQKNMPPDASKASEAQWKRLEQGFSDKQQANNNSPLGSLGPLNPQQIADYWQSVIDQTTRGSDNYRKVSEKINAALNEEFKQRQESFKKAAEKYTEYMKDLAEHQREFYQPALLQKASNEDQDKAFGTSLRSVSSYADLDEAKALQGPTMAEATLRAQQLLGAISASNAAYQQAAISTSRYSAALEKLEAVQAELEKQHAAAQASGNKDASDQIEDKLRQNAASQETLTGSYKAQQVADNAAKYLMTWQGEWQQTLNKMSEQFTDFGGNLTKTFSEAIGSVNDELIKLLTTRHTNGYDTRQQFKAVGKEAFSGLADTGLKGIEGYGIKGLQGFFGKGAKAPDGTQQSPFHVIVANVAKDMENTAKGVGGAISSMPGVGSVIARMFGLSQPSGALLSNGLRAGAGVGLGSLASIASSLPAFASGGPFSAGIDALVGERGPEIVHFGAAGRVIPNNKIGMGDVHHHHNYNVGPINSNNPGEVRRQVMMGIAAAAPHIQKSSVKATHEYARRRPSSVR